MGLAAGTTRNLAIGALAPRGLTWSGELLWLSDRVLGEIKGVDPLDGTNVEGIPFAGLASGLTTIDGALVQVVDEGTAICIIDPQTHRVVDRWDSPRSGHRICGIEARVEGLWLGFPELGLIDLRTVGDRRLIRSIEVVGAIGGVTANDSYVLYSVPSAEQINLCDPLTGQRNASISVNGRPTGVTWDGERVWYCDDSTLQVRSIEVPGILRSR